MNTQIFLDDLDYSSLKQSLEFALCRRVSNESFSSYYHNMSYFVPNELLNEKWQTINYVTKLLVNDFVD